MLRRLFIVLIGLLFTSQLAVSAEFRTFRPILTPSMIATGVNLYGNVPKEVIQEAIKRLVYAWNQKELSRVLSKNFYKRQRLVDSMNMKVPRNAKLRVLSIQSYQTLSQQKVIIKGMELVQGVVSVIVNTEITYNDPANGFKRIEGTNEFIIKIRYKPPKS